MAGRLIVVGTPIGNLDDISGRAVKALSTADTLCCEDTRRARRLLSALSIPAPRLVRLDRHNEDRMAGPVLAALEAGATVALVTDAGMPAISDPGDRVVKAAAAAGYPVEVVPGPCAVTAALALSGLPADQYRFAGFLARKGRDRAVEMETIAASPMTVVVYEAPGRVAQTVTDLLEACGPDRSVVLVRELTKVHEEVWRGPLGDAREWLSRSEPKGEWVLLVGPLSREEARAAATGGPFSDHDLEQALEAKLAGGTDSRSAVALVAAELGVPKRRVYAVAVGMKRPRQ